MEGASDRHVGSTQPAVSRNVRECEKNPKKCRALISTEVRFVLPRGEGGGGGGGLSTWRGSGAGGRVLTLDLGAGDKGVTSE